MARRSAVRTILGTMEFGRRADAEESAQMVDLFLSKGHKELDTAVMYAGGKSEAIIGNMAVSHDSSKVSIATKANPWGPEGLQPSSVKSQMATSLERLQASSVDIFYLHAPDHDTPIEQTLAAVQQLHKEGKFRELALSNYASWQVVEIYYLCKANGWILPTLYQGMYNALTRDVERELFPALRRLGMRFYAYNPLAGGVLTGKHHYADVSSGIAPGRFHGDTAWAAKYRDRFWKKSYFDGVELIRAALDKAYGAGTVSTAEAAIRWMYHHSKLSAEIGDGVIIGASNMAHMRENIKASEQGPLDAGVVEAFEKAWDMTAADCECYFR